MRGSVPGVDAVEERILPWESTPNGNAARLVEVTWAPKSPVRAQRLLCIALMLDVDILSARLGGCHVLFYPSLLHLVEHVEEIQFLGLYEPSLEADESEPPPSAALCVRVGSWRKVADAVSNEASASRLTRLDGLVSRASFFTVKPPELTPLLCDLGSILSGPAAGSRHPSKSEWLSSVWEIHFGDRLTRVTYFPTAQCAGEPHLDVASRIDAAIRTLSPDRQIMPDGPVRLSYASSAQEKLHWIEAP